MQSPDLDCTLQLLRESVAFWPVFVHIWNTQIDRACVT